MSSVRHSVHHLTPAERQRRVRAFFGRPRGIAPPVCAAPEPVVALPAAEPEEPAVRAVTFDDVRLGQTFVHLVLPDRCELTIWSVR